MPLTGGISQALVDAELDAGSYDQIRILVEPVEVVLSDDAVSAIGTHTFTYAAGQVHFPSASTSGLKVKFDEPLEVVSQLTTDLVLDFDLSKNFVFNGPIDHDPGVKRVIFTPVVRASNVSEGGSILVTVWSDAGTPGDTSDDSALSGAGVSVLDAAGNEVASGSTATDGTYSAGGIDVGDGYTVVVTAAGHTQPATPAQSVLAAANLTDFGTVLMQGTLEISGYAFTDNATTADSHRRRRAAGRLGAALHHGHHDGGRQPRDDRRERRVRLHELRTGPVRHRLHARRLHRRHAPERPGRDPGHGHEPRRDPGRPDGDPDRHRDRHERQRPPSRSPGVAVTAVSTLGFDATAAGAVVTDANGQYTLTIPTGTYTVSFDDAGHARRRPPGAVDRRATPPVVTQDMTFP